MSSRRIAKVAEALREIVSTVVLFELKDPRVKNVTVLRADVAPDLRSARIYVSVMGDEKTQSLTLHGLQSARGFIQSKIADRLELRYTPILQFVTDPGVKLSVQASAIIRDALTDEATGPGNSDADNPVAGIAEGGGLADSAADVAADDQEHEEADREDAE